MKLDYCKQDKVKIGMMNYLKKLLDDLSDKYQGRSIELAANHIFKFNKTAHKLCKHDAQVFHTIVSKLLFLCK